MAKITVAEILAEAQKAAEKSAALTAFMKTEQYKNLRVENTPLWFNIMETRTAYDLLNKALSRRAEIMQAEEEAARGEPRPVFLPGL